MVRRVVVTAFVALLSTGPSLAQQPAAPVPLYPGAPPPSFRPEPLPPAAEPMPANPAPSEPSLPAAADPAGAPAMSPLISSPSGRVFCEQPVTVQFAEPDAIPEPYRHFIGIWSDASWTPQLCAALIVENVTPDGTASIVYAFGPMGPAARTPGGILHGTGIIRDGALSFQNSDGSQFVFRPRYADLDGHLTTPQGENYETIFKKTP